MRNNKNKKHDVNAGDVSLLFVVALAFAVFHFFTPIARARAEAPQFTTPAQAMVLLEARTGTVLFAKNADQAYPPASLSKLATILYTFQQLRQGGVSLEDTFLVSEKAWRFGGSKMYVEVGKRISVEDLLRGVIVSSGNDASVVLAEGFAGDETAFADALNRMGREIGLKNSHFRNATGWPDPGHKMSASDIALLSLVLVRDFPEYYPYFAETEFTWSNIRQPNRNPLLGVPALGADGLKTGHTQAAGYGLAASAAQESAHDGEERRLVLVLLGMESEAQRRRESERALRWGFQNFDTYELIAAGQALDQAPVWLGTESHVPLVLAGDLRLTLPRAHYDKFKMALRYESPLVAPVRKGAHVATLVLSYPDGTSLERPVVAGVGTEALRGFARVHAALRHLVFGSAAPSGSEFGSPRTEGGG